MNIKNIIIDANILIKNYNFSNDEIIQLIKLKNFFNIQLCLPKVVYDECIGNYKEDIRANQLSLKQNISKYKKLLVDNRKTKIDDATLLYDPQKLLALYNLKLDEFISKNKIIIIPYPKISHEDVVKCMYSKKLPFKHSTNTETGYKDFLLLRSIEEYQSGLGEDSDIVFFTKNLSDFIFDKNKDEKDKFYPASEECGLINVYLISSLSPLVKCLASTKNANAIDVSSHYEDLSDEIGNAIIGNILHSNELYGDIIFNPENIKNKIFSLSEVTVSLDEEIGFLEISGKCNIQFDCDFNINSISFDEHDKSFVFYDKVSSAIKSQKLKSDDVWELNFYDISYCRTVCFTYIDYEYTINDSPHKLKDLDNALMVDVANDV